MTSSVYNILITTTLLITILLPHVTTTTPNIDPNGYLLYCPCMGRLGNQVDHLLGSLAFAKTLNRTLVVPPFIAYNYHSDNNYVAYDDWFDISALLRYHRVIPMRSFMEELAPSIWPPGERVVYCHRGAAGRSVDGNSCPAKDGSPFGPFWDNFGINFDRSKFFDLSFQTGARRWEANFPTGENFVMASMGAMASYPVQEEHRKIQAFLEWSEPVRRRRDDFIEQHLKRGPYLAIHLRNGMDWERACEHVNRPDWGDHHFMSSPQCTGYRRKQRRFTHKMCLPTEEMVEKHVLRLAQNVSSLFVATDNDPMLKQFRRLFDENGLDVEVVKVSGDRAAIELDLAVMIEADEFIGNCGSSITAFVARKRLTMGKSNHFFGMDFEQGVPPSIPHAEL